MADTFRHKLSQDVGLWLTDGLISQQTHDLLRQRYQASSFGFAQAIKYLGISGGLLAFFGLLGLVGALADSVAVIVLIFAVTAAALLWAGLRLSADPLGAHPTSAKVILALGVCAVGGAVFVALDELPWKHGTQVFVAGVVILPLVGFLAYWHRNIFLLIIGLFGLLHWFGSWTSMLGRNTYAVGVEDPPWMAAASFCVVAVGVVHQLRLHKQTGRFYQAWQTVGLVYLNLSLLILTLDPEGLSATVWILLFGAAAIAQIVAGARLHNGLLLGFGVTAFALNLYTRYFEHFWDAFPKGLFFLAGGALLLGAGVGLEVWLRGRRSRVNPLDEGAAGEGRQA